jgi:hypothetical protein
MSACMVEDPMLVNLEKRFETTYYLSKFRLRKEKCQEDGL